MMLFTIHGPRVWRVGGGVLHDRLKGDSLARIRAWLASHGVAHRTLDGPRLECLRPMGFGTYRDVRHDALLCIEDDTAGVLLRLAFPEVRTMEIDETVGLSLNG